MKRIKYLLCLILVALLLPVQALAAGPIDLSKEVSLHLSYRDGKMGIPGAQFSIYRVASVDETGELAVTAAFLPFQVDFRGENDEAWRLLAATLEGYVLREKLPAADSGKTDKNGQIQFPTGKQKLEPGLYLVLGERCRYGGKYYDAVPFLVMLPTQDQAENTWVYDVSAAPKHTSRPIPSGPATVTRRVLKVWKDDGTENSRPKEITVELLKDGRLYDTVVLNEKNNWRYQWENLDAHSTWRIVEKTPQGYTVEVEQVGITFVITNTRKEQTPQKPQNPQTPSRPSSGKPTLPQTGQLWWPVPVMVCAGAVLVLVGLIRRRSAEDEA